jgi:hypothetical protein
MKLPNIYMEGRGPYKIQDMISQICDSLTQGELDEFTDQWLERVNYKIEDDEIMEKASELSKANIQELASEAMGSTELLEWALEVSHEHLGVLEDNLDADSVYHLAKKVLDSEYVEDLAKEVLGSKECIKKLAGNLNDAEWKQLVKDVEDEYAGTEKD